MALTGTSYRLSAHAVIQNEAGEVLLLKATYGQLNWGLPGGGLEPGETIHDAVRRECREELGCNVELGPLTGVYYHAHYNSHAFIFAARLPQDATITLSTEHSAHRYFAVDELTPVNKHRVTDCVEFAGEVKSFSF